MILDYFELLFFPDHSFSAHYLTSVGHTLSYSCCCHPNANNVKSLPSVVYPLQKTFLEMFEAGVWPAAASPDCSRWQFTVTFFCCCQRNLCWSFEVFNNVANDNTRFSFCEPIDPVSNQRTTPARAALALPSPCASLRGGPGFQSLFRVPCDSLLIACRL